MEGKSGDWILCDPKDKEDKWIVDGDIFKSTYEK